MFAMLLVSMMASTGCRCWGRRTAIQERKQVQQGQEREQRPIHLADKRLGLLFSPTYLLAARRAGLDDVDIFLAVHSVGHVGVRLLHGAGQTCRNANEVKYEAKSRWQLCKRMMGKKDK